MIENSNARSKSRDKKKKKLREGYLFSVRGDSSGMAEIRLSKECCHKACHSQHAKKGVYEVVDYSWRFLQAQRRQRCNPCKRNQTRNRTGLWRQKQAFKRGKNKKTSSAMAAATRRERKRELRKILKTNLYCSLCQKNSNDARCGTWQIEVQKKTPRASEHT